MLDSLILYLEQVIREYGFWGVIGASLLEEIIAPIPSSLIALLAGFFLIPADSSLVKVLYEAFLNVSVPMSLGVTVGSLFVYGIAYYGGKPIIIKYGKWLGINWDLIEKTEKKFTSGYTGDTVLFFLRVVPFIPGVAISAFCGLVRYKVKKFIIITFLGSLIRYFIMGILGYQVKNAYIEYFKFFNNIENFILFVIFIAILVFVFLKIKKKHNSFSV